MDEQTQTYSTGFVSSDGTAVILRYQGPSRFPNIFGVYLRRPGDDKKFYRLSYEGSYIKGLRPCRDIRNDDRFEFVYEFEENTLVWCGEAFTKNNSIIEGAELVPFPDTRRIEYFCGNDDKMFLVTVPKYAYSYEAFHVFIGNADGSDMRLISHSPNVSRMRDGGTTYLGTDEGMFFSPSPFKEGEHPSLDGEEMRHLDASQYVIDETDSVVTITKKE